MDDLISRQEAIKRLREYANDDMTSTEKAVGADYCVDMIRTMPSVQPELDTGLYTDGYNDGYRDGVKDAQPEQQWIPCSERLPEGERKVLCCTATKKGTKNIVIGYYIPDSGYWACGMNSNVVAWMPLPEPYQGD